MEVVASGKKDGSSSDKKDKGVGDDDNKKDKSLAAAVSVEPASFADACMYQMPSHYGAYAPFPAHDGGYYVDAPNPGFNRPTSTRRRQGGRPGGGEEGGQAPAVRRAATRRGLPREGDATRHGGGARAVVQCG